MASSPANIISGLHAFSHSLFWVQLVSEVFVKKRRIGDLEGDDFGAGELGLEEALVAAESKTRQAACAFV